MASYTGGMKVGSGYYWNPRRWGVEVVPPEGGRLPGDVGAKYMKLPFPVVLAVLPIAGLVFLMFLPLIGFVLFANAIARKLTGGARRGAKELASTVSPGWAPGEAHLTGKAGEEKRAGEAKTPELEELEKEIAARKDERK
ncbi:hypothetical protein [Anaeromyxobacter sp. Fw109-5]|uniref:hypothetical protein n=1 Tax=Anaeromyxobacter sp. (strain Fw109-5) TaxID=404589 RepID=UPI0000ED82BF|nr:hypothetical protein [Anaeromyxobacter sp. Fw109-5]ABS26044.1 conserved hypothetical protein [Anaeromyxobacter sp. Fw109-5]